MNKQVLKQLKALSPGDIVCIYWNDASIGSSFESYGIPVPVQSVGMYVGSVGEPKHAILAQNDFAYNQDLRDVDYTAIPLAWLKHIEIIKKAHMTKDHAAIILKNILTGRGARRRRKVYQMRAENHEKLD